MSEEKYPRFRYGYRDAIDKNGFPIMQKTFDGKEEKPVKVWGKILLPIFRFNCRCCDKKLMVGSQQGLLINRKLFCLDCFASGKYLEIK